jgi:hypothetical protein
MSNLPTAEFDPRRVSDVGLQDLRKACINRICPMADHLGEWLHKWCDDEQLRRAEMPDHCRLSHLVAVPNDLPSWRDAGVGHGMAAVTQLSYCIFDEALGLMIDRLCLVFSGECRRRLTKTETAQ